MTAPSNSTPDRSAQSAKRDPFFTLANAIEGNRCWVDSTGEWELPPEENRRSSSVRRGKSIRPTLANVAKQANRAAIAVARYEVKPDGTIVVVTAQGEQHQGNELDEWMAKHARAPQRH